MPTVPPTRLPDWLARRAVDHPDRPAIIAGRGTGARRWSFADLYAAVDAQAAGLRAQGIGDGDRVAVLLRNGPRYAVVVHALARLGAVLVPLNLRLTPAEIAWQVAHARAALLLHDAATAEQAEAVRAAGGRVPLSAVGDLPGTTTASRGRAPDAGDAGIDLRATHAIIYTSGTTGRPKGALLTYGNHWWSAVGSALNLGLREEDRWLVCLPLFHVGGLAILFRGLIYGIPIVFPEAPGGEAWSFDAAAVNRAIVEHGVTIVSVVGAQLRRMLETGDPALPAGGPLRCLLLGGGPAPRPLLEACAARGLPVVQSYGLTEAASQVATLAPGEALRKLGSAGRPLLPTEIRIETVTTETRRHGDVEEGGEEASAADGGPRSEEGGAPAMDGDAVADRMRGAGEFAAGEILVRGPTVSPGYLGDDGATALPAADAEGWLHTGDVGYLDDEGFLYVLDRRTDLIISGGENVYPAEVEAVLLAHPAIAEAGVYGVADPRWGQVVAAAAVARPGMQVEEEAVLAFCRERLAGYKVPSSLRVVEALPRNAAGKLLRRALRE